MTLDPQLKPIVDASVAAAAELPPVWEQTVEQRRAGYLALAELAGPGPDLPRVENITVGGVPCRLFAPHNPRGLLLFFHGGGFVIGDLDTHDEPCRQVALESGATVLSVDYRLAPEHPFPASIEDAWIVLQKLHAEPELYGSDQIAVIGDSAGGNLAAVLAILARDAGIDLAMQILVYPMTDVLDESPSMRENGQGEYVVTEDVIAWFASHYRPDATDWRASPMLAESLEGVAPALVITAQYDPLRDQGIAYARRLADFGVPVTHDNYEGMVHAFFQLGPLVAAAKQSVSQVAAAAREVFSADEN